MFFSLSNKQPFLVRYLLPFRKLSIQIHNWSIHVSLKMKLIEHVIYGKQFNSAVPTHLILCSHQFKRIWTVDGLNWQKVLSTNFIIFNISQKQPFDIIAITSKRTLRLRCVHIAQLVTHPAVYTLPFTLQLCYKPLGILQRVTKSRKVHLSSHDVL